MKKIFGLTTAALAVFALASCSNDDLFGGAENGFDENAVTLEANVEPLVTGDATRAYVTTDEQYDWATGDELRVYDNKLQKFDKFMYQVAGSSKAFVLSNTAVSGTVPQYVDTYVDAADETKNAYALFAGSNVVDADANAISYAGWKQGGTEGTPVALVKIPATIKYKESALSTNSSEPVYKSVVPLWGRVKAPVTDNAKFSTDLKYLTGVIKLTFENANKLAAANKINEVRLTAYKFNDTYTALDNDAKKAAVKAAIKKGANLATTKASASISGSAWVDNNTLSAYLTQDNTKPLCGWFDAELTDNGVLVNTDAPVDQASVSAARGQLKIDVAGQMVKSTSVLFIPVICGKYDVLVVDYNTTGATGTYTVAGALKDATFTKALVKKATVSYPNASSVVDGTNTSAISEGIVNAYDGKSAAEVTFNSDADRDLTVMSGAALLNTIYLPQITEKDLTVVIRKKAGDGNGTVLNNNLTIADAAGVTSQGTGKVTFKFEGFKNPSELKNIIIDSKANIVLAGDFTGDKVAVTTGDNSSSLTLGITGNAGVFNYGSKTLTITKGNLTVNNITYTASTAEPQIVYNNASGTLEVASQVKKVTVTNATSATIKAAVATVEALKNVTIDIPYNTAFGKMTVGTLKIHKDVTAITLKGGIIDQITAEGTASTKVVAATNVTVTSSGLSAIKKNSFGTTGKISFTSSFEVSTKSDDPKSVDAFTAGDNTIPTLIYTGAQLAAIGTTESVGTAGFKLATNITALTNWTSPALTKKFDGAKAATNGLTIAGVDAPLFGQVSKNVEITNVDLKVAISKEASNIGALAKTTGNKSDDGDVISVTNVAISGTIGGQNNVGGVFGSTGSCPVVFGAIVGSDAQRAAAKVAVNVTMTNTTAIDDNYNGSKATYGTFGKFIGQAGTGEVIITEQCTEGTVWTAANKKALHFNYNRLQNGDTGLFEWQFIGNGDLIGYSPAATLLTYGGITYSTAGTTDDEGDGKLAYDGTAKKVTGKFYYVGEYTKLTNEIKNKIKTCGGLGTVDNKADWSGVTVIAHNVFEAYAQ